MGWHPCLHNLGSLLQGNSFRFVTILTLLLLVLSSALKSYKLETNLTSWIEKTSRIEQESNYISSIVGNEIQGSTSELILQTPKKQGQNVLTVRSMKAHLEALAIATHITVDLYDVSWSLKDICFTPTVPIFEFAGLKVDDIMNNLMPCVIKTPLDCFWDGSKILGPDQPSLTLGPLGRNLHWTTLNPKFMIEKLMANYPDSGTSYSNLIDWMNSVGISNGYQNRPCLEPWDPKCPFTAPNKILNNELANRQQQKQQVMNVGPHLTGGCKGFAANLMHWREEEIMGGLRRNKSGFINHADAIQSSVLLMDEHDLYEYWRNMRKVLDITDWSVGKARNIISSWQQRFMEELQVLSTTSKVINSNNNKTDNVDGDEKQQFNIYAMTSKSQLEPIDESSLIDSDNFIISFILMTLFTCLSFPNFKFNIIDTACDADRPEEIKKNPKLLGLHDDVVSSSKEPTTSSTRPTSSPKSVIVVNIFKTTLLALIGSIFVLLIFIASLGISTFFNFSINMATAQILPPLALYYGFNQLNLIAHIYSKNFVNYRSSSSRGSLMKDCLVEITPIIIIESVSYIVVLSVASLIPIQATRTFAYQAIIYILLMTVSAFSLLPPLIHTFLDRYISNDGSNPHKPSNKVHDKVQEVEKDSILTFDDQLISRIQEDLKHIRADDDSSPIPPNIHSSTGDINFTARFDVNGMQTSVRISTTASERQRHRQSSSKYMNETLTPPQFPSKTTSLPSLPSLPKIGNIYDTKTLPDIICSSIQEKTQLKDEMMLKSELALGASPASDDQANETKPEIQNKMVSGVNLRVSQLLWEFYTKCVTEYKLVQLSICFVSILMLAVTATYYPKVNYGIGLSSILDRNSDLYDPISQQEKYFPIHNIFIVTKGNFDYPGNQKLLHEFYRAFEKIDGIIKEEDEGSNKPKFWLFAFRDWLTNLQEKYDQDKNRSLITSDGWAPDVSDTTKLAYKLLAQTGRPDNPIDRNIVDTNRLVDSKGIINVKAFYYYLTAWVMSDSFTYATTEANLKPELKSWNANLDDLKIDKARPIVYAQIPFIIKLPADHNNLKTISEIRRICQAYEYVLPNFPAGLPFTFWDQFINLDITFFGSLTMAILLIFFLNAFITSDFVIATISVIPMTTTSLELYGILGYLSIQFNNILAVLIIISLGIGIIQTVHLTTSFKIEHGTLISRTTNALKYRFKSLITSLILFYLCATVFLNSRMDFMIGYAYLLLSLATLNTFNGLLVTPVLLSLFGSKYTTDLDNNVYDADYVDCSIYDKNNNSRQVVTSSTTSSKQPKMNNNNDRHRHRHSYSKSSSKNGSHSGKKRCYFRVQSNISLSTISEESQSRMQSPDVKIEISSLRR